MRTGPDDLGSLSARWPVRSDTEHVTCDARHETVAGAASCIPLMTFFICFYRLSTEPDFIRNVFSFHRECFSLSPKCVNTISMSPVQRSCTIPQRSDSPGSPPQGPPEGPRREADDQGPARPR
eukprot:6762641-Prymnesium_polylepis.1